ncbi:MAG: tRNA preQ1(34) S-adenosylmethionine ribosyltransferase-isomerase QueA [Myxococcota bacterium]|nr:tRNA preQ1(34) S-adenosylmethionine ribosyltransferase-isomerase QueA [Myxococcota bacterium]
MRRQDFHFHLPDALIAQRPSEDRTGSQLMVVEGDSPFQIRSFAHVVDAFRGDEILVLNDTKVVPARVFGTKETGGRVEMLFVEHLGGHRIRAMLKGKKLRPGTRLHFPEAEAIIEGMDAKGVFEIVLTSRCDLWTWLDAVGQIPLPPYIRRDADGDDRDRYQTVFADKVGAVAAPTAGLHFTDRLLDELRAKGVQIETITLHVGLGTFLPMRVDDLDEHVMHSEHYEVPNATRRALESARPVVAVGTTVVRALESFMRDPGATRTDLFIRPGFEFRCVDGLLTNFHLPESTLLMLVSAFAGRETILRAYGQAVNAKMRFFSYGDAMLLKRRNGRWT